MSTEDAVRAMNESQEALNKIDVASKSIVGQPWSESIVKHLSISVLVFMVTALILCTVLLWRQKSDASEILKIFGVMSIVGLSALLLITGFSNEQLTPIVGLFGAIAGYLLGKETKPNVNEPRSDA